MTITKYRFCDTKYKLEWGGKAKGKVRPSNLPELSRLGSPYKYRLLESLGVASRILQSRPNDAISRSDKVSAGGKFEILGARGMLP